MAQESRINVCEEKVEALQDRSVCCVEHLSISIKWALGNLDWMLPNLCLQGEGWWEFHSLILLQIVDLTIWCFLIFKIYFVCACAEGRGQFAGVSSFLPPCGGRISSVSQVNVYSRLADVRTSWWIGDSCLCLSLEMELCSQACKASCTFTC